MAPKKNLFIPILIFIVVAFVGFADAVYLTVTHFMGELPICTILAGCDEVALSEYSTIGSIPIALLGTLFYATMLVSGVAWLDIRKPKVLKKLPYLTIPAFLFSIWLVYLMFFEIEALCIYCLVSAGTTTLIMVISIWLVHLIKQTSRKRK
ncbi:MAG: vitamin K epoxide reductase family protein [Balneolaceae bacterium]